jgi:hypothetical protein
MATKVRLVVGNDHHMKSPRGDDVFAPGTDVFLTGGVGLDRGDRHPEKIAHATTARIATRAMTIAAMSAALLLLSRNGLKPIVER